jgi:hypothetical protein
MTVQVQNTFTFVLPMCASLRCVPVVLRLVPLIHAVAKFAKPDCKAIYLVFFLGSETFRAVSRDKDKGPYS